MGQETKLSVGDISELLEVVSKVAEQSQCSPAEVIRRIGNILSPETSSGKRDRAAVADWAARLRQLRLRRNELLGAPLFRDPAWDMLLELFAAHENGRKLTVSSLCYASGVPLTTALRQIQRLEQHGLVTRSGCSVDNRRCFVQPTARALAGVGTAAAMFLDSTVGVDAVPQRWAKDDECAGPTARPPTARAATPSSAAIRQRR